MLQQSCLMTINGLQLDQVLKNMYIIKTHLKSPTINTTEKTEKSILFIQQTCLF